MRRFLGAILILLSLCGCGSRSQNETPPPKPTVSGPPGSAPANNGSGIAPAGPNVGGMTPVVGGENLGSGTGGAIGDAAKNRARSVAQQNNEGSPDEGESGGQ